MRLEGSLDAFSLPDIFQLLSFTKKTGALRLRREPVVDGDGRPREGGTDGVVWFVEGCVSAGSSDLRRHQLARRLVGAGLVDDESLASAAELVAEGRAPTLVAAMRESVTLEDEAVAGVVREHLVDVVFDLLRWNGGDFAFRVDEPAEEPAVTSLPVDELVGAARERMTAWEGLARTVPSPACVPGLAAAPGDEVTLTRAEWDLLALLDGQRSVADLVGLLGRGDFAVVASLAGLVERGLVHLAYGASRPAGVAALVSRHALLLALEGAAADADADADADAAPATGNGAASASEAVSAGVTGTAPHPEPVTPVTAGAAGVVVPAQGGATVETGYAGRGAERTDTTSAREGVTPARPEPFLARRRVEHEDGSAVPVAGGTSLVTGVPEPGDVGATVGATALAPAPVAPPQRAVDPETGRPLIDRDPSVNKSLLLRLIAGVRGL